MRERESQVDQEQSGELRQPRNTNKNMELACEDTEASALDRQKSC